MKRSLELLSAMWKFLPNTKNRIYKTKREAFRDFCKVSGANVLWQIGSAVLLLEFGFPTPDVVYDLKRMISPDFDLFCKHGELAEFQLGFENQLRGIKTEERRQYEKGRVEKSPEARFGGIM